MTQTPSSKKYDLGAVKSNPELRRSSFVQGTRLGFRPRDGTEATSDAGPTPRRDNLSARCGATARETAADSFLASETGSSRSGRRYEGALKNEEIRIKTEEDEAFIWHSVTSRITVRRGQPSDFFGEWRLSSDLTRYDV